MEFEYRGVNEAFYAMVRGIDSGDIPTRKQSSRNGNVLLVEEPVLVTYSHPRERVLFNEARDANPFFHIYEAMWMLAGRNDLAPLTYFVKDFAKYSDDGKTLNGAYGYRWRYSRFVDYQNGVGDPYPEDVPWSRVDQLDLLVAHLKAQPDSRRAVLQMWNVEDDLLKISASCPTCLGAKYWPTAQELCPGCLGKCTPASKDVCCNLSVMFSIRTGSTPVGVDDWDTGALAPKYLDMTVTNRSNDMILGMLGANFVHFTFLQEYMAARLGVEVGKYHHFTNNLHVYESNWKPREWLGWYDKVGHDGDYYQNENNDIGVVKPGPMLTDDNFSIIGIAEEFNGVDNPSTDQTHEDPFIRNTVWPMLKAHDCHKWPAGEYKKKMPQFTKMIESKDWQAAAISWLMRRQK